jgi:hypothetical protein
MIRELEATLSLMPLFAEPLSIMIPDEFVEEVTISSSKVTKVAKM